jgi:hypothetical protein
MSTKNEVTLRLTFLVDKTTKRYYTICEQKTNVKIKKRMSEC